MTEPNKFIQLHAGSRDASARTAHEAVQYEQKRVEYVIGALKLKHHERAIRKIWMDLRGEHGLRFSAFNEHFGTFPFVLGTHTLKGLAGPWPGNATGPDYHIHRDKFSAEPMRYANFGQVPFVVAYKDFFDSVAAEAVTRKVALIVPRKGPTFRQGLVIHNDDSERFWTHGLCQVYKMPGDKGAKLYVQPFSNLVAEIYANGRGWKPLGE